MSLARAYRQKQVTPVEVTQALLTRIHEMNPKLNAFVTLMEDEAMEKAKLAGEEIRKGNWQGPLHGVPIGLKDLIYTAGVRTTMGSEIYKDFIPDYNATVVEKLEQNGAIIIGKLNTHEFAYGPTGDISCFGPVHNPYDLERMTGGSSSGSGAAVAAGLCFGALGTDTGGSVRIPSSACGIVGMKTTFGRVSKYGVFPLAYSLDTVGPMTRTVRDNAMMLTALAGYDSSDPYSAERGGEDFTRKLGKGVQGKVLGVPTTLFYDSLDDEVRQQVDKAIQKFKEMGAEIREVDIDLSQLAWGQLMTIRSEAYAVHAEHMRGKADQLHPDVRMRLEASKETMGWEYIKAQEVRRQIIQSINKVFEKVEALIAPTIAVLPPKIGQREVELNGLKEHVYSALLRLNGPANFSGLPSISIPCGFSKSGLPIGMQLIGKHFSEANLYRIAEAIEEASSLPTLKWDVE
nr:amidase [Ammoniphilus resinae]